MGELWAYRERAYTLDCPVIRAEILQIGPKKSGKVRIRLHGGEFPGLDQWVPKVRLRVPCDESEAWLRDEQALEQVRVASEDALGAVTYGAAKVVFAAYPHPEGVVLGWPWGTKTLCIPQPEDVAVDMGLDMQKLLSEPLAFIDRHGEYYAPASIAERLVHLVIESYSHAVLALVTKEERELREEALHGKWIADTWPTQIPAEKCAEYLREREPVFHLVREWCGQSAVERFDELTVLRAEVQRLRELVTRAADHLDEAGSSQRAYRLRKQLAGSRPSSNP